MFIAAVVAPFAHAVERQQVLPDAAEDALLKKSSSALLTVLSLHPVARRQITPEGDVVVDVVKYIVFGVVLYAPTTVLQLSPRRHVVGLPLVVFWV